MTTCCMCWIENQPSPANNVPAFVRLYFLSILWIMKFFVKDFSTTMQARVVIFVMQVDDDILYRGIENQSFSCLFSPCICPIFFRSLLWIIKFFIKAFFTTIQARLVIFGIKVDDDMLYLWDWEPAFSCLFFPVFVQFSFFPYFGIMKFYVKDFSTTMQARVVIFGMQVDDDMYCIVGLRTSLLLFILPCICPIFFLLHTLNNEFFLSKDFSMQPCKLE